MINSVPLFDATVKPTQSNSEIVSVEQKLNVQAASAQNDSYVDELYASLKASWQDSSNMKATELIKYIAQFVAANGQSPYQNMRTHVATISQLMQKMKLEGDEGSDLYKVLNQSVGYSIISNGFLDSFIGKMIQRPEELDGW